MKYIDNCFNGKTILIDADSLCYTSHLDDFETAKNKLDWKIERIRKHLNWGGEKFIYFLTMGKSFRNDLLVTYKENRRAIRPDTVKQLKEYIINSFNIPDDEHFPSEVILKEGYEADDLICDMYREDIENYVLCSIDKDILYNMVGRHINLYDISEVTTNEFEAEEHFYKQIIKGDTVDNIPNLLPGVGDSRLEKLKEYSGISYKKIGMSICEKLNINYNTRYRLLYCGDSEELEIPYEIIENDAVNDFIDYSNKKIKLTDIDKKYKKSIKKEKPNKKIIKRKTIKEYSPTDKAPGKHKDKTWLEVKEVDTNYINWMIGATKDNKLKEMLEKLLNYNE